MICSAVTGTCGTRSRRGTMPVKATLTISGGYGRRGGGTWAACAEPREPPTSYAPTPSVDGSLPKVHRLDSVAWVVKTAHAPAPQCPRHCADAASRLDARAGGGRVRARRALLWSRVAAVGSPALSRPPGTRSLAAC